jgi:hypothetical protein
MKVTFVSNYTTSSLKVKQKHYISFASFLEDIDFTTSSQLPQGAPLKDLDRVKKGALSITAGLIPDDSPRQNQHVEGISLLILDIDTPRASAEAMSILESPESSIYQYNFFAYHTLRSDPANNQARLRIVIEVDPSSVDHNAPYDDHYCQAVKAFVNKHRFYGADTASQKVAQAMVLPIYPTDWDDKYPRLIASQTRAAAYKLPPYQKRIPNPEQEPPEIDSVFIERVKATLDNVDPSCSRDLWIETVVMPLHHAFQASETGFQLFHDWSSKATNGSYKGEQDCRQQWDSLSVNHEDPITIRTFFRLYEPEHDPASSIAAIVQDNIEQATDLKDIYGDQVKGILTTCTFDQAATSLLHKSLNKRLVQLGEDKLTKSELRQGFTASVHNDVTAEDIKAIASQLSFIDDLRYVVHEEGFFSLSENDNRNTQTTRLSSPKQIAEKWHHEFRNPVFKDFFMEDMLVDIKRVDAFLRQATVQVDRIEFNPRQGSMIPDPCDDSRTNINSFRKAKIVKPQEPQTELEHEAYDLWLDHLRWLFPDSYDRAIVYYFLHNTTHVMHQRLQWALLLQSDANGIGKTMLSQTLVSSIVSKQYVHSPEGSRENSKFDDYLDGKLLIAPEEVNIKNGDDFDQIKSKLTNEDREVEGKMKERKQITLHCNFLYSSNKPEPMAIPPGDRRIAAVRIPHTERKVHARMSRAFPDAESVYEATSLYYGRLVDAARQYPHVLAQLILDEHTDLSKNHPFSITNAPDTVYKRQLQEAAEPDHSIFKRCLKEAEDSLPEIITRYDMFQFWPDARAMDAVKRIGGYAMQAGWVKVSKATEFDHPCTEFHKNRIRPDVYVNPRVNDATLERYKRMAGKELTPELVRQLDQYYSQPE